MKKPLVRVRTRILSKGAAAAAIMAFITAGNARASFAPETNDPSPEINTSIIAMPNDPNDILMMPNVVPFFESPSILPKLNLGTSDGSFFDRDASTEIITQSFVPSDLQANGYVRQNAMEFQNAGFPVVVNTNAYLQTNDREFANANYPKDVNREVESNKTAGSVGFELILGSIAAVLLLGASALRKRLLPHLTHS